MVKVISTGSVIVDLVVRIPGLPPRGGDVLGHNLTRTAGGGFNLAAAIVRYGVSCVYGGMVGTGPNGTLVTDALTAEGIDFQIPASIKATTPSTAPAFQDSENTLGRLLDTGTCITLVETDGERTFVTAAGAEAKLTTDFLQNLPVEVGDVVAVSGYELAYPESRAALATWVSELPRGVLVSFDPGPLLETIPSEQFDQVLRRCNILTLNQREARVVVAAHTYSGVELAREVRSIAQLRENQQLVVREGAAGCVVSGGELRDHPQTVPAPRVDAVDTTGAGDAHTGVLLAALVNGASLIEAALTANHAAALTVTRKGPATAPTRKELTESLHADKTSTL